MREIKVKNLSIVLIFLEAFFVGVAIFCAAVAKGKYNAVAALNKDYARMQTDIYNIKDASDFLTARSRQYVTTGEAQYAFDYYTEVNTIQRREKALKNVDDALNAIKISFNNPLPDAVNESRHLAETELHAMALVYSISSDGDIPPEILEYKLSPEELALDSEARKAYAIELNFGKEYSDEKETIMAYISEASDELLASIQLYQERCSREYRHASLTLNVLLCLSAGAFAIDVLALFITILRPIQKSIYSIEHDATLEYGIGYELNYLTKTFNHLLEINRIARLSLQDTAEKDALTGLLNRNGYEGVKAYYTNNDEPISFLMIDADHFKDVNDNFGHEEGDNALKRIASLIRENFRDTDYVVRFGGDEFLVIMTGNGSQNREIITRKLTHINEVLVSEQAPGKPKLSISAGVAFSEHGYTEDIFKQADEALYRTKSAGRCGFSFYN